MSRQATTVKRQRQLVTRLATAVSITGRIRLISATQEGSTFVRLTFDGPIRVIDAQSMQAIYNLVSMTQNGVADTREISGDGAGTVGGNGQITIEFLEDLTPNCTYTFVIKSPAQGVATRIATSGKGFLAGVTRSFIAT